MSFTDEFVVCNASSIISSYSSLRCNLLDNSYTMVYNSTTLSIVDFFMLACRRKKSISLIDKSKTLAADMKFDCVVEVCAQFTLICSEFSG